MALSGLEQRIPPLGNTFLDFPAQGESDRDLSPRQDLRSMQRSKSFSGYSPWRMSKAFDDAREKTLPKVPPLPQSQPSQSASASSEKTATNQSELQHRNSLTVRLEDLFQTPGQSAPPTNPATGSWSLSESILQRDHSDQRLVTGTLTHLAGCLLSTMPTVAPQFPATSPSAGLVLPIGRANFGKCEQGLVTSPANNPTPCRSQVDSGNLLFAQSLKQQQLGVSTHKEDASPAWLGDVTTIMIRNLPLTLNQKQLLQELDRSGFAGMYDFVYMPCSFQSGQGKGFAFVNMLSADAASELVTSWHRNRRFDMKVSEPALNLSAAEIQGHDANMSKWSTPRMRRIRNPNLRPFTITDSTPQQRSAAGSPVHRRVHDVQALHRLKLEPEFFQDYRSDV